MNLLVTGGYGFIASNFINYYFVKNEDCKIINIDAMYYCANVENVLPEIRASPRYVEVIGNIQSGDLLDHILKMYNVTHVIHFAAQSHVQNSFSDSLQYTRDNILGTHTLLESCRKLGQIELFIHVSTDEVYGESMLDSQEKMNESSLLCPTNPYAATKAGAEIIAMSYYHSFKMPIIITRGNNVYGPGQYPEKLIPRFIKLLKNGEKVTIQGDGSCTRNFLYVDDVVRAFDKILMRGEIGEIYNIGGAADTEYSVMEIAIILIGKIKGTDEIDKWITYVEDRPFNDKRYYIDNEKLLALGWDIKYTLDLGLAKIL
jgi:dTDP-glucose 4,6-dehydratase